MDEATQKNMMAPELRDLMALMIWKTRHYLTGPLIQITEKDREAFKQSLDYNGQTVKVNAEDRNGTTLIHLTDPESGDQIVFTENNEADLDKAQAAAALRSIRQNAPNLAFQLRGDMSRGVFSDATIEEACRALEALAKG